MKSILEIILGDLEEKNFYHQLTKRAMALPGNYYAAFKKIRSYMYNYGGDSCNTELFSELLDLFEEGVASKKTVSDIIGDDAAEFCDELIRASNINRKTKRDKLNREIEEYFVKRGKDYV